MKWLRKFSDFYDWRTVFFKPTTIVNLDGISRFSALTYFCRFILVHCKTDSVFFLLCEKCVFLLLPAKMWGLLFKCWPHVKQHRTNYMSIRIWLELNFMNLCESNNMLNMRLNQSHTYTQTKKEKPALQFQIKRRDLLLDCRSLQWNDGSTWMPLSKTLEIETFWMLDGSSVSRARLNYFYSSSFSHFSVSTRTILS